MKDIIKNKGVTLFHSYLCNDLRYHFRSFSINQHVYLKKYLNDWEKVNHSIIPLRVIKLEEKREREKMAFLLFITKQSKGLFQSRGVTSKHISKCISVSKGWTAF